MPDYGTRRAARIRLNVADVHTFLDLPEDLRIVGVVGRWDPPSVDIAVEGDHLDPVPLGAELPILPGSVYSHRRVIAEDGKVYGRWSWSEDGSPSDIEGWTNTILAQEATTRMLREAFENGYRTGEARLIELSNTQDIADDVMAPDDEVTEAYRKLYEQRREEKTDG